MQTSTVWEVVYEGRCEGRFASKAEALNRLYALKNAVAVPWKLAIVERAKGWS